MKPNFDKLTKKLTDLDIKAEELDNVLQNVRLEINNVFWELIEFKKIRKRNSYGTHDGGEVK